MHLRLDQMLEIPVPGGHMPSVILCRGQDQWLSEFLGADSGIQQHQAVTWWVPSKALDALVADLCARGGAEVIDWREHMLLTCTLRDEGWRR